MSGLPLHEQIASAAYWTHLHPNLDTAPSVPWPARALDDADCLLSRTSSGRVFDSFVYLQGHGHTSTEIPGGGNLPRTDHDMMGILKVVTDFKYAGDPEGYYASRYHPDFFEGEGFSEAAAEMITQRFYADTDRGMVIKNTGKFLEGVLRRVTYLRTSMSGRQFAGFDSSDIAQGPDTFRTKVLRPTAVGQAVTYTAKNEAEISYKIAHAEHIEPIIQPQRPQKQSLGWQARSCPAVADGIFGNG